MVTEEQYAAVVAENTQLRQREAELTVQLQAALERIAALETQVAELQAKKMPPPSFVKANAPTRPAKARAKRAAEHNHGRPQQAATQVVGHAIRACPDCGNALGGVQIGRTRQVIELPVPPPVEVIEHQVQRGWCSACRRWREARLDLRGQVLGPKGRLGVGIAALVAHLRTRLRLPLRTIQRYLADLHGLQVSVGEVVELLHRVAACGAPSAAAIRERVRTRAVVHADETGWREAGRNGYVWGLATPEGERSFAYAQSRAGAVINTLLGADFRGVLVTDFYGGYNDTPGGQHQRCWVHLLRDVHALAEAAQDAATASGALSREGLETRVWTAAVTALWQRVRAASTSPPADGATREATYQTLLAEVQALGAQFVEQPDHPCRALAWRLWHFQGELLTCVRRPDVPADNNAAERALRPLVVARKISGGTRSARGSQTRMALATLAATWSASGLAPLDEFRRLLQSPLPQI
jgi:transposase